MICPAYINTIRIGFWKIRKFNMKNELTLYVYFDFRLLKTK